MNEGVKRFLSRREKDPSGHRRDKSRDKNAERKLLFSRSVSSLFAAYSNPHGKSPPVLETSFSHVQATITDSRTLFFTQNRPRSGEGISSLFKADPQKKSEQEQNNKISSIKQRLQGIGYSNIEDEQIHYALASKYANGDADRALDMVVLFQESVEGIVKPYNPKVHMLGAENKDAVTCYLDTLLFSMFGRLSSFEPLLYTNFDDEPRRRLSTLIRLWVNMLRTGKLIQTDITKHLQEALAACGWDAATRLEQQDTSEAFQAITDILNLPLLTLKVDLVHGGKDDSDDHKLIQERLLNVAVPDEDPNGAAIKLEDCLESYFNGRVDVNRFLERTQTNQSISSAASPSTSKEASEHVEISELSWSTPNTPTTPQTPNTPLSLSGRLRATSIIRRRMVETGEGEATSESSTSPTHLTRKGSIRKEVLMPAWQFYHLIPWHTEKGETPNENKIADHFQSTRPVLGVCLKRYTFTPEGRPTKKRTYIDIPLDLRLPHFVNEDQEEDRDHPLEGQFKLSLQSVICHRGEAINSGHYVAFIRGTTQAADGDSHSTRQLSNTDIPPSYSEERWIMFDDNGIPRVQYADIGKALKGETPYLLFYQVQPIYDITAPPPTDLKPPSYTDSGIGMSITECSPNPSAEMQSQNPSGYFDGPADESAPTIRLSSEYERHASPRMSMTLADDRRGSLAHTEVSVASLASTASSVQATSAPVTPSEETTAQRFGRAAASMTKFGSKSRPSSQSGENRISATFSRLNLMGTKSKEQLSKNEMVKDTTKQNVAVPNGVAEPRKSITIEDSALRPAPEGLQMTAGNGGISRSKSKKEKKRDKSKGPSEKLEHEHHNHKDKGKGKVKDENKVPDRECTIM
ncbi:cysteine proteinase [Mollisia scopiformis]|uniref:ubiquitinyl hydrolase 1 n=1 Tax=Mollisia scopiformis TaxID=149040 RepID=A0A194XJ27_MOLSC|nr:cysteine proteinase [Mollisia scopiformis]KUJ20129.1 cysteine proteinase [Mollisia scopiformis]